jgi:hypothetical protein
MIRARALTWLLALLAGSGCTPATPRARAPGTSAPEATGTRSLVERFLPLEDGTVFSYDLWLPGQATPELLILEVERRKASASLKTGSVIRRVVFEADGVRLLTGGYLLKAPLALGATWPGPAGAVSVTALDQQIQVPAGSFNGCVETTETAGGGELRRTIVTSYCPRVGITRFSVESADEQQRFELKSFGPRVDIDKM